MRFRKYFVWALAIIGVATAVWFGARQGNQPFTAASDSSRPPAFATAPSVATTTTATPPVGAPTLTAQPQAPGKIVKVAINPATLPPDTVWTFRDGPATRTYMIAMDELYVPSGAAGRRVHGLTPQPSLAALLASAATLASQVGVQPQLVLYPLSGAHDEAHRMIVAMQVHIATDDLAAVKAASSTLGLSDWTIPGYAPGHAIATVSGDPAAPLRAAAALAKLPQVSFATPMLGQRVATTSVSTPNDPYFSQQWHLLNTGQGHGTAGIDINVTPVWPTLKGTGIGVGIVDDSLQLTHPDLAPNVAASGHYDWNGNDSDPSPDLTANKHGTAVAGLVAACADNDIGVSGVAPGATLYGLRLIADPYVTDDKIAQAMAWNNDVIQVKNNSWGPIGSSDQLYEVGSLWQSAVADGTSTGRGSLGTIYVFSAGNGKEDGDQGNKSARDNNIHVIAVSALTDAGVSTYYSEGGAHVIVSAPGGEGVPDGITTTDLTGGNGYNTTSSGDLSDTNYTKTFDGTSAAAPIVSGVVALMLEANPNLGWRDVQEILLRSSTKLKPTDPDWVSRDGGQPSLPLIKHHPFYGGGLINAQAATTLAASWSSLAGETTITTSSATGASTIPDAGPALSIPLTPSADTGLRVEHVEITVNIVHAYRGDLEIKLTSPSGTVSTLATPTVTDSGNDYDQWTFTSVRHWGETSLGTWTLSVRDAYAGDTGSFVSATLAIHGVTTPPPVITLQPQAAVAAQGADVSLAIESTGENVSYQWSRNGTAVTGATSPTLTLSGVTLDQAGAYACTLYNQGGRVTSHAAQVVVYASADQSTTLNPGTTFTAPALTAGQVDSFQWYFNGAPLADSSRISGATTAQLTVRTLTLSDAGDYTLHAVLAGNTLPTGAIHLTVRTPPDVATSPAQTLRLGATAAIPLTTDGGTYNYIYYGLPKGITYDSATGVLSGRTTAVGIHEVVLMVSDAFGLTTTLNLKLTVERPPAALVGVFNGTVARDPVLNANLGGTITLATTSSGGFTGRLTLGATSYAFKGMLDGAAGSSGTADVVILRTGLSPLRIRLALPVNDTAGSGTVDSTVAITAWHCPWSKTTPATAYTGNYVLALETPAGSGWPAGYTTGSVAVTATGAVNWTLQPADGTPAIKGATTLSADGTLPLYAPAKIPAGSFLGALTLPAVSTPSALITGSATWLRGATTSTRYANASGFGPISLTPHGGRYVKPASLTTLLGLPVAPNNVDLEFGGSDVNLGSQAAVLSPTALTLTGANKVVLPSVNPTGLKLLVSPATGLFSGSFTLIDPNLSPTPTNSAATIKRAETFSGVFLPQEGFGAGFFILPALPGSETGTRSGSVLLIEAP